MAVSRSKKTKLKEQQKQESGPPPPKRIRKQEAKAIQSHNLHAEPGPSNRGDRTFFPTNQVIIQKSKKGKGHYLKGRGRKAWVARKGARLQSRQQDKQLHIKKPQVIPQSYIYSSPSSSSDENVNHNNNVLPVNRGPSISPVKLPTIERKTGTFVT